MIYSTEKNSLKPNENPVHYSRKIKPYHMFLYGGEHVYKNE